MPRAAVEAENRRMLGRQRQFRAAADVVTDCWIPFTEVAAVAVIGSVAVPLWKEVPRFSQFRRERIEIWHECGDLDLALWLDSQERLGALRRTAVLALREAFDKGTGISVASHQLDVFLIEPGTDRYLGRLCHFSECPKGTRECLVSAVARSRSTSASPNSRRMPTCSPQRRGATVRSALGLPQPPEDDT